MAPYASSTQVLLWVVDSLSNCGREMPSRAESNRLVESSPADFLMDLILSSIPEADLHPDISQSICIIGAGPAGLAALKIILDSPQYKAGLWKATAFEARDKVGGIWWGCIIYVFIL